LEPILEPKFDKDSYGYRPKNRHTMPSAWPAAMLDYDWVLDLDIKSFSMTSIGNS